MFGPDYIVGSLTLSVLTLGFFMGTVSFAPHYLLTMVKETRMIFVVSLIATLTNVVLNLTLIPLYGILGAAIATTISYLVNSGLLLAYSWHVMHILPFSTAMIKSIPAGFISIGVVYLASRMIFQPITFLILLLLFALFFGLYVTLVLISSGLQREDVEILKAIEKKTGLRSEAIRNIIRRVVK